MARNRFDYIIVGAGSAGCIVARRLADDGAARVLLLEAGPRDNHWTVQMPGGLRAHYESDSRFNWHYHTTPQTHLDNREVYQPRGKTLGGSSSINGMVYLRGNGQDYQRWAQQGARGWSYADVLPYFKRLERHASGADLYRGGDGPVGVRRQDDLDPLDAAFLEAGRQAGHPFTGDVNGAQQEGFSRFDMNVAGGMRSSASRGFLRDAPANLEVRTEALGHRILFEGRRAVGFEYSSRGRTTQVFADREVILSAGAVGSPHLLMLSGVGPADHLRHHDIAVQHDLPGVGDNLHDHLEVHIQQRCTQPVSLNRYLRLDRKVAAGIRWFLFKSGICARNQANVGAFLCSNPSVAHANIQFHFFPVYFNGWDPRADVFGYMLDAGPMRPTSRGTLRLAAADPTAAPLIDPNFLATENDREEVREGFLLARDTLAQAAFAPYDGGEAEPGPAIRSNTEIDAYIRQSAGSAYHLCGSCKMGAAHDATAVVDPVGRVRGLEALRIADASIMPSIVSSNTNAPSMMIGEKLADAILGKTPLAPIDAPIMGRGAGG